MVEAGVAAAGEEEVAAGVEAAGAAAAGAEAAGAAAAAAGFSAAIFLAMTSKIVLPPMRAEQSRPE